jgi:hypothetical protein
MELFISILLIIGSLIAGASSLYGLKNKLYTEQENGKRVLLPSGRLSIALTVVGLLITVLSGILGYQMKQSDEEKTAILNAQAERDKKVDSLLAAQRAKNLNDSLRYNSDRILLKQELEAEEINAKNKFLFAKNSLDAQVRETRQTKQIILSSQLLRSLQLIWTFQDQGHTLQRLFTHDEKTFDSSARETQSHWHDDEYNSLVLWPLLNQVFKNKHQADGTNLILIALDDDRNSILSFGNMDENLIWDSSETKGLLKKGLKVSGGITIGYGADYGHEYTRTDTSSNLEPSAFFKMTYDKDALCFNWYLDPAHLPLCVDNQSTGVRPLASMPKTLKIALLYKIKQSPFLSANFSQPDADAYDRDGYWWQHFVKNERPFLHGSTVQLIVNTLGDQVFNYHISDVYYADNLESVSNIGPIPCTALVLEYQRD